MINVCWVKGVVLNKVRQIETPVPDTTLKSEAISKETKLKKDKDGDCWVDLLHELP